jgi:DNA excision repair protein ERCC-4
VIIVVDSREQKPLCFGSQPTRIATLRTGDYTIDDCIDTVAIERKSLSDLYGCVGQSRDRFERELERMTGLKYGALVIEATLSQILGGSLRSRVHPQAVFGSLMSWSVKGRLPIFFAGNRDHAAMTVAKLLEKCAKHHGGQG